VDVLASRNVSGARSTALRMRCSWSRAALIEELNLQLQPEAEAGSTNRRSWPKVGVNVEVSRLLGKLDQISLRK